MKQRSLFFHLLLTFSLLGLGIIFSFFISFKLLGTPPLERAFTKNVYNYINYIINDISSNPTQSELAKLQDKLKIGIIYNEIKSSPDLPSINELKQIHKVRPDLSFSKLGKKRFFVLTKDNNKYAFFMNMRLEKRAPFLPLFAGSVLAFLLLFLTYKRIRKLFYPLQTIAKGADLYAKGRFDFSLKTQGHHELVHLAQSIERMGAQIKKMLESKRELLMAIGHELKTPLTRSKLHLELIDDPRKKEIELDLEEMSQLVNDLLESERLQELGHQVLNREECDIKKMIEEILKNHFSEESIEVTTQKRLLKVDPLRYSLVFKNLISNSIAHGKGEIKLEQNQNGICLSNLSDQISEEEISHLTSAFYRIDSSRSRLKSGGGMGIGLYLVSQICKAHDHDFSISYNKDRISFKIKWNLSDKQ